MQSFANFNPQAKYLISESLYKEAYNIITTTSGILTELYAVFCTDETKL